MLVLVYITIQVNLNIFHFTYEFKFFNLRIISYTIIKAEQVHITQLNIKVVYKAMRSFHFINIILYFAEKED